MSISSIGRVMVGQKDKPRFLSHLVAAPQLVDLINQHKGVAGLGGLQALHTVSGRAGPEAGRGGQVHSQGRGGRTSGLAVQFTTFLPAASHVTCLKHCTQFASYTARKQSHLHHLSWHGSNVRAAVACTKSAGTAWVAARRGCSTAHMRVPSCTPQRGTRQPTPAAAELDRRNSTHASRNDPRLTSADVSRAGIPRSTLSGGICSSSCASTQPNPKQQNARPAWKSNGQTIKAHTTHP